VTDIRPPTPLEIAEQYAGHAASADHEHATATEFALISIAHSLTVIARSLQIEYDPTSRPDRIDQLMADLKDEAIDHARHLPDGVLPLNIPDGLKGRPR
jgi:hypothetical protein